VKSPVGARDLRPLRSFISFIFPGPNPVFRIPFYEPRFHNPIFVFPVFLNPIFLNLVYRRARIPFFFESPFSESRFTNPVFLISFLYSPFFRIPFSESPFPPGPNPVFFPNRVFSESRFLNFVFRTPFSEPRFCISAGELKHETVVSDRQTHGLSEFILVGTLCIVHPSSSDLAIYMKKVS
jgi:hypothetical protein